MKETSLLTNPIAFLAATRPADPVQFCAPGMLAERARVFLGGFPGCVSFAVKANPTPQTLRHILRAGIRTFDVASPTEIALILDMCPEAALHYNNPVRDRDEIAFALRSGVRSFAVDARDELTKLADAVADCASIGRCDFDRSDIEISIRFKLPMQAAAYDFGAKFGATPDVAANLLARVDKAGFRPALTFHPGTQCTDPQAFADHIAAAARIAHRAGTMPERLNVGGGFPSNRTGSHDLSRYFAAISGAMAGFGPQRPALICEPGRALTGDAFALAARVKSLRPGIAYLNDGIYGGLSEFPSIGLPSFQVITPDGRINPDRGQERILFGPTCDALDRLPGPVALPVDLAEGDYLLFSSMGAYVAGVSTTFNGYGQRDLVEVSGL